MYNKSEVSSNPKNDVILMTIYYLKKLWKSKIIFHNRFCTFRTNNLCNSRAIYAFFFLIDVYIQKGEIGNMYGQSVLTSVRNLCLMCKYMQY